MIKILLPIEFERKLITELQNAGTREIGGVLMGEHVSEGVFRIKDLTFQREGGTWIRFVRRVGDTLKQTMKAFFQKNEYQYTKYNYIGEWHSHPSFALVPSLSDQKSMWEVVNDPHVGANFAVLLIVKLDAAELKGSINLFVPEFDMQVGELILEGNHYEG